MNLILVSVDNGNTTFHKVVQKANDHITSDKLFRSGMDMIADFRNIVIDENEVYGNDFDIKVSLNFKLRTLVEILPDNKEIVERFKIFHIFKRINDDYY